MRVAEEIPPLLLSDLHRSLSDSAIGGMNFLNEVMTEYPSAVSFAPGAPNPSMFDEFDMNENISSFLAYRTMKGFTASASERLMYQYGPSRGIINDLIAQALYNDNVVKADPREIVVTAGAQEAMLLALRALFRDPGDVLVVSDPSYVGIVGAARLLGIEVVPVSEGPEGLDLHQLQTQIVWAVEAGKNVRAVYVAPDFANPSGALMSLARRHALLDMADQHNFYVLEDSAYAFMQDKENGIPALKTIDRLKRVILIGTFAKIALPGIRVGYAVADQSIENLNGEFSSLAAGMATLKSMVTVNTSPICQAIAGGLLLSSGISIRELGREKGNFYRANLVYLLDRLEYHCQGLPGLGSSLSWNSPSGGFFVRVTLPVPADWALLRRSAVEFGVLWTPMRQFFLTNAGDYEIRLSCSYLDHATIDRGANNLARFFSTILQGVSHERT